MSKTWKLSSLIVFIIIFLGVGSSLLPKYLLDQKKNEILIFNQLSKDLNYPLLDINPWQKQSFYKILDRWQVYYNYKKELQKISLYNEKKELIKYTFNKQVDNYIVKVESVIPKNFTFSYVKNNNVPFIEQKNPITYLNKIKAIFKQDLINYNQQSIEPLRWELSINIDLTYTDLSKKVSQLFIFGMKDVNVTQKDKTFLAKYPLGGLILYQGNINQNVKKLNQQIQQQNTKIPLFIAVDQEGGYVKRILTDPTPSARKLAKLNKLKRCQAFKKRDNILFQLGFNWNYGLIADVTPRSIDFIYSRTFSDNYQKVGSIIEQGVICSPQILTTLKHYPGHGAVSNDTHFGLGIITKTKKEWLSTDLLPFKQGIKADSFMLGHLILRWQDQKFPMSLSKKGITYLRQNLKFNGLIITDDLKMLKNSPFTEKEVLKLALQAGSDVLLYNANGIEREQILQEAIQLVKSGVITKKELNTRISRIINAKNKIIKQGNYVPAELIYPVSTSEQ